MKLLCKGFLVLILGSGLSSCSVFTAKPTETPLPTATLSPAPTNTPQPTLTPTPQPTATSIPPTETPSISDLLNPSSAPLTNWEGFSIMPGAIAGDGDSTGYYFTINASPEIIQNYYIAELSGLGLELFANGRGGNDTVILFFQGDEGGAAISIIPQSAGLMLVMLVKT